MQEIVSMESPPAAKPGTISRYILPVCIFLVGLGLSLSLAFLVQRQEDARLKTAFTAASEDIQKNLVNTLRVHLQILDSVADLYAATPALEREIFETFLKDSLSRHPEIYRIQWVLRVSHAQRAAFEDGMRKEGFTDFETTEQDKEGNIVRAPSRVEYFPIYYSVSSANEPGTEPKIALGFNHFSDIARKRTMERARDKKEATASPQIPLLGETGKEFGILIFRPVYLRDAPTDTVVDRRKNLTGYVAEIFQPHRIVDSTLESMSSGAIDFVLYDDSEKSARKLLHFHPSETRRHPNASKMSEEETTSHPELEWSKNFKMAGRKWTIVCRPAPEFFADHNHALPWLIGATGILLSLLLAGYVLIILANADIVKNLVRNRTRELNQLNETLAGEVNLRKKIELRLATQYAVIRVLAASPASQENVIPKILHVIGETMNWQWGEIWMVDSDTHVLRCLECWQHPSAVAPNKKIAAHPEGVKPGMGVPGKIWAAGEPLWIGDLREESSLVSTGTMPKEPCMAFGFPIRSKNQIIGVVAFYGGEIKQPDYQTLEMFSTVGLEMGHFFERKHAEEALRDSEAYSRSIIEKASNAFVSMDANGIITDWNRQAELIFGWSRKEAVGRSVADTIIPPALRESHWEALAHFFSTGEGPILNKQIEVTALHRDGHEFPVELTVTPIRTSDTYHFNAFVRDITERKRAEEQREAFNKRLQELNALKDEFVVTVSHELRSPLSAMKEDIQLVLDGLTGPLNEKQSSFLGKALKNIDRLTEMITNLLDVSKIEAGRLHLDRIRLNMKEVAETAVANYKALAGNRSLQVNIEDVPRAFADLNRVLQVLGNLVSNAIKFTKENGTITIRAEQDGRMVAISVQDNGVGIWKEDLSRLFKKFSQVGGSESRVKGTGLGLALCKDLVEMHGGTITVESRPRQGSTFTFTLPVYNSTLVLKESFKDALDLAKSTQKPATGLLALDMSPFLSSFVSNQLSQKWERLDELSRFVHKHVDHDDIVFALEPHWVVVLAPLKASGLPIMAERVRKSIEESVDKWIGKSPAVDFKLHYGTALYPRDGTDPQSLFAKATGPLS